MTEKLNLNTLSTITYYSIPEQLVVNPKPILKENEVYSIYSGYLRSSPNDKLMIKKYAINDNLNDLTNHTCFNIDHFLINDHISYDIILIFICNNLSKSMSCNRILTINEYNDILYYFNLKKNIY